MKNYSYLCIGVRHQVMDRNKNNCIALLFSGHSSGTNLIHVVSKPDKPAAPETEESRHSPSLPDYIEDKKDRGIEKYADTECVCNVINHNIRPADLWGEVIGNVKAGTPLNFINDLRHFGNYEAGAN